MAGERITLFRKQDRVHARIGESDGDLPVNVVWARPISGRGGPVSILDLRKKKEVALLGSLDDLDPASRRVAAEELEIRYLLPRVTRVRRTSAHFGNRYWEVETDRGPRRFLMKDPNKNAVWVTPDHLVVRDTLGNRYEIPSVSALDDASRAHMDRVL
jgi:hypothetical protein